MHNDVQAYFDAVGAAQREYDAAESTLNTARRNAWESLKTSTDPFVVFTSNAFAILGLRSLYFLLADAAERFRYLRTGLAVVLAFVGVKLLLADVIHLPALVSLGVVVGILAASIGASVFAARREARTESHGEPVAEGEGPETRSARDLRVTG